MSQCKLGKASKKLLVLNCQIEATWPAQSVFPMQLGSSKSQNAYESMQARQGFKKAVGFKLSNWSHLTGKICFSNAIRF